MSNFVPARFGYSTLTLTMCAPIISVNEHTSRSNHAMQIVEVRPRNLTLAHFIHGWLVSTAPAIGEFHPIDIQTFCLAPGSGLGKHRTAPVHNRAKYIEDTGLYVGQFGL